MASVEVELQDNDVLDLVEIRHCWPLLDYLEPPETRLPAADT